MASNFKLYYKDIKFPSQWWVCNMVRKFVCNHKQLSASQCLQSSFLKVQQCQLQVKTHSVGKLYSPLPGYQMSFNIKTIMQTSSYQTKTIKGTYNIMFTVELSGQCFTSIHSALVLLACCTVPCLRHFPPSSLSLFFVSTRSE